MSKELDMFKGNSLVTSDLFKELMESTKRMAGGSGGYRRISIRGGRFREIVDGEQMNVKSDGFLNVVIVDAAPVSRFFYKGTYDSNISVPPTCWSTDTQAPSPDVPEDQRQASRCMDCPQNVKGSGQGESRACRFSQRLAVALEGQLDKVYQMQVPATSIFGEAKGGHMPLQHYTKYLINNSTPTIAIITKIYFDEDSETPKLFFKPERPLTDEELEVALKVRGSEDTKRALDLTVSQTDGVQRKEPEIEDDEDDEKPKKEKKKKDKAAAPSVDEVEEPKKREKKEKPAETVDKTALADLVSEWDDD